MAGQTIKVTATIVVENLQGIVIAQASAIEAFIVPMEASLHGGSGALIESVVERLGEHVTDHCRDRARELERHV